MANSVQEAFAAMQRAEHDIRRAEVEKLLRGALYALDKNHFPESAIWRLVDAAGLIWETLPEDRKKMLIGVTGTSGRGYRLALPGQVIAQEAK